MISLDKLGVISISFETLRQLLKLPPDVQLVRVLPADNTYEPYNIRLVVTAHDLPLVCAGSVIPDVTVLVHTEFCREDEISHIVKGELKWEFVY